MDYLCSENTVTETKVELLREDKKLSPLGALETSQSCSWKSSRVCCEGNRIGTFSKTPSKRVCLFLPDNIGSGDQITATFHLNFVPLCLE